MTTSGAAFSSTARPLQSRTASWRVLILYALAIVGPTLALLYLGLVSVNRQRDAITTLTAATERLQLERLADALETRALERARACLMDERTVATLASTDWASPESAHVARASLDAVCRAHPMCADLMVISHEDGGTPLLDEPLPRSPDTLLAERSDTNSRHRLDLFAEASRAESEGRTSVAWRMYEAIAGNGHDPRLRALALGRLGALHARRGDRASASTAWRQLASEYPAAYDLVQRPQAVVAALELAQLSRAGQSLTPADPLVDRVRLGLAAGQWHVSPGQAEYFAARFDAPAAPRGNAGANALSPFWKQSRLFARIAVASEVRAQLERSGPSGSAQVRPLTFVEGGKPHQVFTVAMPGRGGQISHVAVDADLAWVQQTLLPLAARETGGPRVAAVAVTQGSASRSVFSDLFPFWSLSVVDRSIDRARWWTNETVIFGGTTAGVLAVLVLGVVLLVRDVGRDAVTARVRSDLVSGVSHELKTPLSVIRLYAEALADEWAPEQGERAAHSRVILHESERLSHLVERVLEFSRHEGNPPTLDVDLHDPSTLVATFADRYTAYVAHLGFRIERELEPAPPMVRVDAAALTQALVNLIDNAVKYAGESRRLVLRVRASGSDVFIEVEDHGIGIPSADRARLFEAFQRGSRTVGRGGYGLGLYLVSQIMQAHGGRIDVDSPDGGGTCMRLVLPACARMTEA